MVWRRFADMALSWAQAMTEPEIDFGSNVHDHDAVVMMTVMMLMTMTSNILFRCYAAIRITIVIVMFSLVIRVRLTILISSSIGPDESAHQQHHHLWPLRVSLATIRAIVLHSRCRGCGSGASNGRAQGRGVLAQHLEALRTLRRQSRCLCGEAAERRGVEADAIVLLHTTQAVSIAGTPRPQLWRASCLPRGHPALRAPGPILLTHHIPRRGFHTLDRRLLHVPSKPTVQKTRQAVGRCRRPRFVGHVSIEYTTTNVLRVLGVANARTRRACWRGAPQSWHEVLSILAAQVTKCVGATWTPWIARPRAGGPVGIWSVFKRLQCVREFV